MNLINLKEVYNKIINGSTDDSKLRNYIRSIVEESISEATTDPELSDKFFTPAKVMPGDLESAAKDFKDTVYPLYTKDWDQPKGFDEKFVNALKTYIDDHGEYGVRQIWNYFGDADGTMPVWWDKKGKTIKKTYIKK